MSSSPLKSHRKRPADSEVIELEDSGSFGKPDDRTLDEILKDKRRRIEGDDAVEEGKEGTSDANSKFANPSAFAKQESTTSSKHGSPQPAESEIIYQLSPEPLSLSPTSSTSDTPGKLKGQLCQDVVGPAGRVKGGRKTREEEEGEIFSDLSDAESKGDDKLRRHSTSKRHKKEGATDNSSDGLSDSEKRKSYKQQRFSSSEVADSTERPKQEELRDHVLDSEQKLKDVELQKNDSSSLEDPGKAEKPKNKDPAEANRGLMLTAKRETETEESSDEEESGNEAEITAATKRVKSVEPQVKDMKENSNSESDSEESSDEDEDEDDDEEDDTDEDDKVEVLKKENNVKDKPHKVVDIKKGGDQKGEVIRKEKVQDNEESSSEEDDDEEEDISEEESEESESEMSEESEEEQVRPKEVKRIEEVVERRKEEEFESEDIHSELKLLKRQRPVDEKYRERTKIERRRDERSDWRQQHKSSDAREKLRKVSDKEKMDSKYERYEEKRYSQIESKSSRGREKSRSGDKIDGKEKGVRSKHKLSGNLKEDISRSKADKSSSRGGKYFENENDRDKKHSRKDPSKRKSPDRATRDDVKDKERKDHSGSRKKSSTSDKSSKDSRVGRDDSISNKPKKGDGPSLILTEREKRQFSNEIVDSDHEESSSEDEKRTAYSDSELKQDHLSDREKEKEKETKPKLPPYYPAVRGCRNVEEFQWLNRIEEGTYGVVYRAKDKRTGDIVALKKLKMEREKEGFPITSLREINTLLKAQHPNIVTVREIVVGSNMDKIYIVMDYVEHDLKVLMEHMTQGFRIGEIKTLMIQLLRAVAHLHDNWILHRDIKASNLLLSNKGILKVGDFGLAREYGSPLKNYTPIVVTLWYRAPELLLGTKEYSTPVDLWSVGCVFAELLTMKALFPGKSEIDQINRIFKDLGTPSDKIWPGPPSYSELPAVKKMTFTEYPYNNLRNKFGAHLTDKGFDLLNRFLTYDPGRRITAEDALKHQYFAESPLPVDPSMFPTWPAKSEMMKRPKKKDVEHSPQAPEGGAMFAKLADEGDSGNGSEGFRMPASKKGSAAVVGFTLKF
ncbi:cyclin-dependent kinase 11B-like [Montipora capricornis]|uniref:cyclin-dependent kinase 11B-like n=1 Tax=Montipora capricornis TaxID=246305 RepID=UPI0035F1E97A